MLKAIKRLFSREEMPMVRWSPEHLAEIKDYLESKPPAELSREDWHLVVEWLGQRYFPEDDPRTESEWQENLAAVRKKIDRNIDHPELIVRRPSVPGVVDDAGDPEFTKWMQETLKNKGSDVPPELSSV